MRFLSRIECHARVRHAGIVIAVLLLWMSVVTESARAQSSAMIYEGFTEASRDILVSGSELGRLQEVKVRMGDAVEKGQVLALMDDVQQRAAVRLSQAQSEMTGDLDLAIAEERMHFERFEKIRELAKRSMARPDEVKRQESQWKMASARVTQARDQQRLRQLQLERDQLQLERRRIVAPMSGVIARVLHFEGEYITPADSAVFQLLHVETLEGIFNIPAEEMSSVRIGKSVRVFLRSCSETVEGVIDRVSPSIEGKSGTVQIRVRIDNPDGKYLHGDRCTLRLELDNEPVGTDRRSAFSLPVFPSRQSVDVVPKRSTPLVDASFALGTQLPIAVVRPEPKVLVQLGTGEIAAKPPRPTATRSPREPNFQLPGHAVMTVDAKDKPGRKSATTLRLQAIPSNSRGVDKSDENNATAAKPSPEKVRDSISRAWLKDAADKPSSR